MTLNAIPDDLPPASPPRRPDAALPLVAAAFCLGVVASAAGLLGLQISRGDTVPASTYRTTATELAGVKAARVAADDLVSRQGEALASADALAQRLVAALDRPSVSPAELAALRREVREQSRTVERVRVVRVPVPGPTVTAAPAARSRPQTARQEPAPPTPTPSPPGCTIAVLGTCLAR